MTASALGLSITLFLFVVSLTARLTLFSPDMKSYRDLPSGGIIMGFTLSVLVLFESSMSPIGLLPFMIGAALSPFILLKALDLLDVSGRAYRSLLVFTALLVAVGAFLLEPIAVNLFWRIAVLLVFGVLIGFVLLSRWSVVTRPVRYYISLLIVTALGLSLGLFNSLASVDSEPSFFQSDGGAISTLASWFVLMLSCVLAVFYLIRFVHEFYAERYQRELEAGMLSKGRIDWSREMVTLDRQRSLGLLANSLQHQLRQPLAAMKINAQILRRLVQSNGFSLELARSALEDVVSEASRFHLKTKQIARYVSRREEIAESFDLVLALREVVALIESEMMNHKVGFSFTCDAKITCFAPRSEFQHAIFHLLMNAVEACSSQFEGEARSISLSVSDLQGQALIEVRDSATGMSEAQIARAGLEIFTTKPDRIGLGLLLVRQFLDTMGGDWVLSKEKDYFSVALTIPTKVVTEYT